MHYRKGTTADLLQLQQLGIEAWSEFKKELSLENWQLLFETICRTQTYQSMLQTGECLVCEMPDPIVGMIFLIPRGNPTDLFLPEWSYIRFLTVSPAFVGKGIGRRLTEMCIATARKNDETIIALHTSEIMNKARSLYERMGFKMVREIVPRPGKRYWLYQLQL